MTFPLNHQKPWSHEEERRLRLAVQARVPRDALAMRFHRTERAIAIRCRKLGLCKRRIRRLWRPEEVEIVLAGYKQISASKLAKQLGRTKGSVVGKWRKEREKTKASSPEAQVNR